MNKSEIYENLKLLNRKLKDSCCRGELYLYGGAVMCLCLNARETTRDIDSLFEPKNKIYQLTKEISEEKGLRADWLNDAVKGFISSNNEMELFDEMSNLTIYRAKYDYLFAMKCLSCRLDPDSSDIEDIRFLINYLNIENIEKAEEIILRYFPEKLVLPKQDVC